MVNDAKTFEALVGRRIVGALDTQEGSATQTVLVLDDASGLIVESGVVEAPYIRLAPFDEVSKILVDRLERLGKILEGLQPAFAAARVTAARMTAQSASPDEAARWFEREFEAVRRDGERYISHEEILGDRWAIDGLHRLIRERIPSWRDGRPQLLQELEEYKRVLDGTVEPEPAQAEPQFAMTTTGEN
jgi:hypothetical protein